MSGQQPDKLDTEPVKRPVARKRRGFTKGDPRFNRKLAAPPGGPVNTLAEMQRICREPPWMDRTRSQRRLRKWFNDDFRGFVRLLTRLQREAARAK